MQPAMAMTEQEKHQFFELQRDVRVLKEDFEDMVKVVTKYRDNQEATDKKINSILTLVRGIAIGLAIGGVLFGLVKLPDLVQFFTK